MKYKKDAEGFIIISLTAQEIEKYDRATMKYYVLLAVSIVGLLASIAALVKFI